MIKGPLGVDSRCPSSIVGRGRKWKFALSGRLERKAHDLPVGQSFHLAMAGFTCWAMRRYAASALEEPIATASARTGKSPWDDCSSGCDSGSPDDSRMRSTPRLAVSTRTYTPPGCWLIRRRYRRKWTVNALDCDPRTTIDVATVWSHVRENLDLLQLIVQRTAIVRAVRTGAGTRDEARHVRRCNRCVYAELVAPVALPLLRHTASGKWTKL